MLKSLFSSAPAARHASPYAYPLKLNLGCGYKKMDGYLNVDKFGDSRPDLVLDLEVLPWPFPDSSVTHITMASILEHIGQQPDQFLKIIQELWRICAPGAELIITVPHPRHDHFLGDPTHVRPILPATLQAFDQVLNRQWIAEATANTPLGLQLGVDFHIDAVEFILDDAWRPRFTAGEISAEQVMEAARSQNNVISDFTFKWIAQKPCRG